jgi:uncharacterized membrane protein
MKHGCIKSARPGERGAVALISAVTLTAVFGMAALAIDLGALYSSKRELQAATDSAAMAATYGLNSAPLATPAAFASSYLARNGFPAAQLAAPPIVTTGRYCPTAATTPPTPNSRFVATNSAGAVCPGDPTGANFGLGPNAVQVTSSIQSPLYFGRVLLPTTTAEPITTTATATQINEAGFSAGTGVASVNMGAINAVLSAVLGGSVSLSAVSYNGLLQTNVTALDFLGALSTQLGVSAGTYGSLLQSNVGVSSILSAAATALAQENSVASANVQAAQAGLGTLQAAITGNPTIQLSQLLNLGVWQNQGIGTTNQASALNAGLNLYDLATLSAEIANGQNALTVPPSSVGIPGLLTITAASTVIEPPQSPPFVFGPVGVTVHTSQVRLQLAITLLNALSIAGGTSGVLQLPLYIEAGSGNAKLTNITCGLTPATDATVTIDAQSGVGYAYVGTVSPSTPISNFSQAVTVTPAVLSTLGVPGLLGLVQVQVTGYATVALGSPAATALTFNQTQIAAKTAQTVSSTGMVANLLQNLVTNTQININTTILGLPLPSLSTTLLTAAVQTLLAPVAAALDPLVDSLLAGLGVKLGYMDVTVTGVRCGVPALVL